MSASPIGTPGIPGPYSVFRFCTAQTDIETGLLYLTDPVPFGYDDSLPDNIEHTVSDGDTWETLAATYYAAIPADSGGGSQLWRVIVEFQPVIPMESTIPPARGSIVYVPSLRTVTELIFSEDRRPDYEA